MTVKFEEIIKALESVGHLEEAELLRKSDEIQSIPKKLVEKLLVFCIANTLEDKRCVRGSFPCSTCTEDARTIKEVVLLICERVASYAFINLERETSINRAIDAAISYGVKKTKDEMIVKRNIPTSVDVLSSSPRALLPSPKLLEIDKLDTPKIIRISERDKNVLSKADEVND